jgi:hypothetical protein
MLEFGYSLFPLLIVNIPPCNACKIGLNDLHTNPQLSTPYLAFFSHPPNFGLVHVLLQAFVEILPPFKE